MTYLTKVAFLTFSLFFLHACSLLRYSEPTEGPRAKVRFVTNSTEIATLMTYSDTGCKENEAEWMRLRDGYFVHGSLKTLGMPLWNYNKNSAKEVFVQSDKKLTFMFIGYEIQDGTRYDCGVPFTFSFSKNNNYEVKYLTDKKFCQVSVSKLHNLDGQWMTRELARYSNKLNEATLGCMEAFKDSL